MKLQYFKLLHRTHFTHKQNCFPVLAFELIRERYVVVTTSEGLLALYCTSCEGFSTSGNAVVTSQERAARSKRLLTIFWMA